MGKSRLERKVGPAFHFLSSPVFGWVPFESWIHSLDISSGEGGGLEVLSAWAGRWGSSGWNNCCLWSTVVNDWGGNDWHSSEWVWDVNNGSGGSGGWLNGGQILDVKHNELWGLDFTNLSSFLTGVDWCGD